MAKIKINKNSLPKGFTVRDGKVIKTYAAGGATVSNTLKPVDRDAANLEAEKGEMVLTDTSGDGVFELYNVGGKRHSEGGTALNLPDQSFVYSDTRGMLLTKDEMKSLGIEQKKRITPAKAAKKFPLNEYIETLEDETSDKIAVETAEQMINKNKIMLSQIAFIQESKKDFENGLPLAAFPYLMAKGVDPQQFQQKIDQINAEKNPQQQPQQGMAQGMPPQGMPPQGPPQGGPQIPPEMMMAMQQGQQGPPMQGPPQGMMPPQPPTDMQAQQMMKTGGQTPLDRFLFGGFEQSSYSVAPVENTSQDNSAEDIHPPCPAYGNPPPSAAMKHAADTNKNYKGPGMKYGGDLMAYQTQGELKKFIYGGQDSAGISVDRSTDIELDPLEPSYTSNPMYRSLGTQLHMMQTEHSAALRYHKENPHMFKEKKAQKEFEEQLNELQSQMHDIELQMRSVQRRDVLAGSIMDLDQSMPNVQIADPSMYIGSNPAMQGAEGAGMMMAKNGMELPKMSVGQPICTGSGCSHSNDHDSDKYKGRQKGRDAHTEFHNHVMSEDFNDVRDGWIESYRALEKQWEDVVASAGGIEVIEKAIREGKNLPDFPLKDLKRIVKNKPVTGKSADELFTAYMDMNDKLLQAKHAGYNPIDFATKDADGRPRGGYKDICEEFGWGDCEGDAYAENAKMFQGMFTAMHNNKLNEDNTDQEDAFYGNITLDLKGELHGSGHRDINGLPMSDIDGIIGKTSAGQYSSATNEVHEEELITDIKCDEAEQKRIAAECLKNGQEFDLETCSCKTKPETPKDVDTPPYMTFPQDDLRLQNAIDQKWSRNLYMPTRQNVDPVLPDVAYQDPQAMIQANLAMAQQLAKADPANASYYMGQISDKINKGISDVANTNIKIFDNSEARKSQILNDAMATNSANRDEYNTRVATALNNFDNTMAADNANIVDVQVDRMDHADKLYALNNENPNFYYDAQNHMNTYYNPNDLNANKPTEQMTFESIEEKCRDMNYKPGSADMLKCIEMYKGQATASSTPTRSNMHKDESNDTEEVKYGNEVGCTSCNRKQELARSKKALRDWIFGV